MRKILLATTALVGFVAAGAAQAATSPLTVNVGGSVDVLAGVFHNSAVSNPTTSNSNTSSSSFETLYDLNFGVNGKSGNGIEYGANLSLNNNPDISNYFGGNGNSIEVTNANLFLSGAFGKVQLGDSHGATDLALLAPVVGEGQVYGRYMDFLDTTAFAKTFIAGVDVTDHSTNVTYFTPKVKFNDKNSVQAAVSYVPNFYNYGTNTVQYTAGAGNAVGHGTDKLSPYKNVVKVAGAYTGTFNPVTVGVSADAITGGENANNTSEAYNWLVTAPTGKVQNFTSWSVGAQAAAEGFTLGGNYLDLGHYDTVATQSKSQHEFGAGLKYEFSKVALGVSYLGGEGYSNTLAGVNKTLAATNSGYNYVKDFTSYGVGGSYAWAAGLTTNLDGVAFQQKSDAGVNNDGYVLLVSQKLAF